ncbi:hypothetical protein ABPG72_002909 [Tetrahymena utriculariae]
MGKHFELKKILTDFFKKNKNKGRRFIKRKFVELGAPKRSLNRRLKLLYEGKSLDRKKGSGLVPIIQQKIQLKRSKSTLIIKMVLAKGNMQRKQDKYRNIDFILDDESYFTLTHSCQSGNDRFYSSDLNLTPPQMKFDFKMKFEPKLLVWIAISPRGISKPYYAQSGLAINSINIQRLVSKRKTATYDTGLVFGQKINILARLGQCSLSKFCYQFYDRKQLYPWKKKLEVNQKETLFYKFTLFIRNKEKSVCRIILKYKSNMKPQSSTPIRQDNARPHISKQVLQYFDQNNISLLEWASQSPDINPIEKVWSLLKHKINKNMQDFQNLQQLKDFTQQTLLNDSEIKNLISKSIESLKSKIVLFTSNFFFQPYNIKFLPKDENPANLPYVRPIEDFWAHLKLKVYDQNWEAKTTDDLRNRIKYCLKKIDLDFVQKLASSTHTKINHIVCKVDYFLYIKQVISIVRSQISNSILKIRSYYYQINKKETEVKYGDRRRKKQISLWSSFIKKLECKNC